MAEFSCAAAGADSCGWRARSTTEEGILQEVTEHLQRVHNVKHVTRTLAKYAAAVAHNQVDLTPMR